jgi:hypothetical protein
MKKIVSRRLALVAGVVLVLAACGGGGDGGGAAADPTSGAPTGVSAGADGAAAAGGGQTGVAAMGTLRLALTDAPACGFDKVYVTVERVRVHQSSTSGEAEAGWSEIVLDKPKRLDLLSLTNGVLEELGQTALPAGKYQQLRLVLSGNGSTAPFANAVIPTGSKDEVALSTPSADQSGLKINTGMDVIANQTADFVIDFDACKSIVTTGGGNGNGNGNAGKYLLKPVLTVSRRTS